MICEIADNGIKRHSKIACIYYCSTECQRFHMSTEN